jgi:hypothetical protein
MAARFSYRQQGFNCKFTYLKASPSRALPVRLVSKSCQSLGCGWIRDGGYYDAFRLMVEMGFGLLQVNAVRFAY